MFVINKVSGVAESVALFGGVLVVTANLSAPTLSSSCHMSFVQPSVCHVLLSATFCFSDDSGSCDVPLKSDRKLYSMAATALN